MAPTSIPAEFELPDALSVEVMILWGDNVLHLAHLTPPRSFYVGEEESKNLSCDFFLPQDKLGTSRAPVVVADPCEGLQLVLLAGAKGFVEIPGHGRQSVETLIAHGHCRPCAEVPGAMQVRLAPGCKAKVTVGDLSFIVSVGNAARKAASGTLFHRDWTTSLYVGLSMAVHTGLLVAMAGFMPSLGLNDDESMSKDQLYLMQQYLTATAEPQQVAREEDQTATDVRPEEQSGGTGKRAVGAEGSMGNPVSRETNGAYGVKGDKDNKDPHIARANALREVENFGMIGLLNTGMASDADAPTAPWGRDDSYGNDALSARGNMWGDAVRDAFGSNGLGLSGVGEGGNGPGEGIGLGSIGTIGRGDGLGDGQGFGNGHGHLKPGGHKPSGPRVRLPGMTTVTGQLPPEVIQRIVRQNFGRFRVCYEGGLRDNPSLRGRVGVRFVIGRDGAVSQVSNAGSDLPNPGVVSCVTSAFYGLSFPAPQGGIVTVGYPIVFEPGE